MWSYQVKNNSWRNEILKRFADREDLGKLGLYDRYFRPKNLGQQPVLECLDLLEDELKIPPGILRPEDSLNLLFETNQVKKSVSLDGIPGPRQRSSGCNQ